MHSAVNRLADVVFDREPADEFRLEIQKSLHARPLAGRRPQFLERTVGGHHDVKRSRPVLTATDLDRIVEAAGSGAASALAIRDQALLAVVCWSGLSLPEALRLNTEAMTVCEPTDALPWCVWFQGISRRRRSFSIPVHARAAPFLHALTASGPRIGPLFRSSTAMSRLSYTQAARVLRNAVFVAGIIPCDDTTIRRAYTYFLKASGLNDYAIRDALGVLHVETVHGLLKANRRSAARSIAAEHHVVELPSAEEQSPFDLQQPLPLDGSAAHTRRSPRTISVLGVDAALRKTGWALMSRDESGEAKLHGSGTIMARGRERGTRLKSIEDQFYGVLRDWRPTVVIIEKPGGWMRREGSSRNSIEALAMARAAVLMVCSEHNIAAVETDFVTVRAKVLRRGNARKSDAAEFIASLGIVVESDDEVDAVVLGLFGLLSQCQTPEDSSRVCSEPEVSVHRDQGGHTS